MTAPALRRTTLADAAAVRGLLEELGYGPLEESTFSLGLAAVLEDPVAAVAGRGGRRAGRGPHVARHQAAGAAPGLVVTIDELVVAEHARGRASGSFLPSLAISVCCS